MGLDIASLYHVCPDLMFRTKRRRPLLSCCGCIHCLSSLLQYRAASTYCCVRQSRDSGVTNTGRHYFPLCMPRFSGSHLLPFQGYNSAARHLPLGEHPTQGAKEPALGWSDFHAGPTLLEAVYGCDILESVPERASSLLCRIYIYTVGRPTAAGILSTAHYLVARSLLLVTPIPLQLACQISDPDRKGQGELWADAIQEMAAQPANVAKRNATGRGPYATLVLA